MTSLSAAERLLVSLGISSAQDIDLSRLRRPSQRIEAVIPCLH
jgi:hypothetical protein